MLTTDLFRSTFDAGTTFADYARSGTPDQRSRWEAVLSQVHLTPSQLALIAGFSRTMNVLCLSGLWCGDCVHQCPMLHQIEKANPDRIRLRFVDRDEHPDTAHAVSICGGLRVPTVIFANEDHEFVGLLGDRTLSRYRAMAARQLGPSCPLPGAALPADESASTLQDWVDEFERVQLLLRLSPKLRQRHGD